jgi:glycosyltransferase involved in cell wall biosynthesis
MRIVTNFARFPETWKVDGGETGEAKVVRTFLEFAKGSRHADLLIINGDVDLVLKLSAYFLLFPFLRKPIIAVDLVLRRPEQSKTGDFGRLVKKFLYGRVDHFIHYFTDLSDYQRFFGIGPERSSFVPFKPNIRYRHEVQADSEGEYVLCFGRSLRDYDTFFDAMERVPYPGAIPQPNFAGLKKHNSRFTRKLSELPENVKLLEDDGSSDALVRIISGARIVVLPILKVSLLAGIGTYLNAMYMRKCVIVSEGPGCSDVLSNQALFVPPEAPQALADMIQRVWLNEDLREATAQAGYRYAVELGGEPELRQRILENAMAWLRRRGKATRPE